MRSLSGLGIWLSLVCGILLLALVAEIYYLTWWKKKEIPNNNNAKEIIQLFCWKKAIALHNPDEISTNPGPNLKNQANPESNLKNQADPELGLSKDSILNTFGEEDYYSSSVEAELMKLHNLAGPLRFLFTIKEETKDDLESEDGKSRILLSPLASPRSKLGFNPLFESSSSPPPKLKFLRDAEEKLLGRLTMEKSDHQISSLMAGIDVREGSFLVGKHSRSSTQILPLDSSSPIEENKI